MSILLYRVDERLIHGQVVVGWGAKLRPERFVVVDRDLPESEWEQELYLLGVPDGAEAIFLTPTEAALRLEEWEASDLRILLLTRDIQTMLDLSDGGGLAGKSVNLGGIHFQAGKDEVLPYLFLNEGDKIALRALSEAGASVSAQDLPGSQEVQLDVLLA